MCDSLSLAKSFLKKRLTRPPFTSARAQIHAREKRAMTRSTPSTDVMLRCLTAAMVVGALRPGRDLDLIAGAFLAARTEDEARLVGLGITRTAWSLDSVIEQQCRARLRFDRDGVLELMAALDFPAEWTTPSGSRFTGEEAMTFYLRRMAFPNSLLNLSNEEWKAQPSALSEVFTMVGRWMYAHHTCRLLQTGIPKWSGRVAQYRDKVSDLTGFRHECFGIFAFVDGTAREISRPGRFQRAFYSGHKRHHIVQFLSVTAPDGMILFTYGPTGVHNDNWLLNESQLATRLLPDLERIKGSRYVIYGDPIFGRSMYVQRGFGRVEASDEELAWNEGMNAARVTEEWCFGRVAQLWQFIDFSKTHKLHSTSPARTYLNAQFLTNCHNCMYGGNQISQYFECPPPSLHDYLNMDELPGAAAAPHAAVPDM